MQPFEEWMYFIAPLTPSAENFFRSVMNTNDKAQIRTELRKRIREFYTERNLWVWINHRGSLCRSDSVDAFNYAKLQYNYREY